MTRRSQQRKRLSNSTKRAWKIEPLEPRQMMAADGLASGVAPGDLNADGAVSGSDFLAWQRSFAQTPVVQAAADASGTSGAEALQTWESNFGAPLYGRLLSVNRAMVTVREGETVVNGGFFDHVDSGLIELTASAGEILWTADGTWSWSLTASDGLDGSHAITVTALFADGEPISQSFELVVNNQAPTLRVDLSRVVALAGEVPVNTGSWQDPGADAVTLAASTGAITEHGDGTWSWAGDASNSGQEPTTVTISATDADGYVRTATFDVLSVAADSSHTFTISDNDFANRDWTHIQLSNGHSFTTTRRSSGGNGGAYQRGVHTYGPGQITVAHILTGSSSFNPAVQGNVTRIDVSYDFRAFMDSGSGVGVGVLLRQGDNYYVAAYGGVDGGGWTSRTSNSLRAGDFSKWRGSGPAKPDFSASGETIEVGYVTANSTSGANVNKQWGIDNFRATFSSIPPVVNYIHVSDSDFFDRNWTHKLLSSGHVFETSRKAEGGNVGGHQHGTHTYSSGQITVAHVYSGAGAYDPSLQGAIKGIEARFDFRAYTDSGSAVGVGVLLRQGDSYYVGGYRGIYGGAWTTEKASFLQASDFEKWFGSGHSTPDFSATALPIDVGYVTANSTSGTNVHKEWAIDNLDLTIASEPRQDFVVAFNDADFRAADWDHQQLSQNHDFSTKQAYFGGNDGAYQQGTHTYGDGQITVAHVYKGSGTFNPAARGAARKIDAAFDFRAFMSADSGVGVGLLLRQGKSYYVAGYEGVRGGAWTGRNLLSLEAEDFTKWSGDGPAIPDFSASAAEFEVGYVTANSTSAESATKKWGVDNFKVEITSAAEVPEVVVDNHDAQLQGRWQIVDAADAAGGQYLQNTDSSQEAAFTPIITHAGRYDVYLRWPAGADRASRVTVVVHHRSGASQFVIDQRQAASDWHHLRAFDFQAGDAGRVTILAEGADGVVAVDAVRFVPLGNIDDDAFAAYRDSSFLADDWRHEQLSQGQEFSMDKASGSFDGGYQRGTHRYQSGQITVAHLLTRDGAYNPAERGPIEWIDASFDVIMESSGGVGVGFLVEQDGHYFVADYAGVQRNQWGDHRQLSTRLKASDFERWSSGAGPDRPDFSNNGEPFYVGYVTANSTRGDSRQEKVWGIDNFQAYLVRGAESNSLKEVKTSPLHEGLISLDVAAGTLHIQGTSAGDFAKVEEQGAEVIVTVVTGGSSTVARFSRDSVREVAFKGGDGNDYFANLAAITSYGQGQAGDDILLGAAADDILIGNEGDDVLIGGGGRDLLAGRAGRDVLYGMLGNDELEGHAGDDWLLGGGGADLLLGGAGDDFLIGDGREDDVGNDRIWGDAGYDWIYGGSGNDQLFGGGQNDTLSGGSGDDLLNGGAGDDILIGMLGVDTIDGAVGVDLALSLESQDIVQNVENHGKQIKLGLTSGQVATYTLRIGLGEVVGSLELQVGGDVVSSLDRVRDFTVQNGILEITRSDYSWERSFVAAPLPAEMSNSIVSSSSGSNSSNSNSQTRSIHGSTETENALNGIYNNGSGQLAARTLLDSVGLVRNTAPTLTSPGGTMGTGTLLSLGSNHNQWVLTADHVVDRATPGQLTFRIDTPAGSTTYSVSRIIRRNDIVNGMFLGGGDLALLQLNPHPASGFPPIQGAELPDSIAVNKGIEILTVGYGWTNDGTSNNRAFGFSTVDDVKKDNVSYGGTRYWGPFAYFRYDHGEAATARGDSGGPDFAPVMTTDNSGNVVWVPFITAVHGFIEPGQDLSGDGIDDAVAVGDWTGSSIITQRVSQAIRGMIDSITPLPAGPTLVLESIRVIENGDGDSSGQGEWHFTVDFSGLQQQYVFDFSDQTTYDLNLEHHLPHSSRFDLAFYGYENDDGIFSGGDDAIKRWDRRAITVPVRNILGLRDNIFSGIVGGPEDDVQYALHFTVGW